MNRNTDIVIASPADFDRYDAELQVKQRALQEQARTEQWSEQQIIDARLALELPYFKAFTDPSNPVMVAHNRQQHYNWLRQRYHQPQILTLEDAPHIRDEIARQTTLLNRRYGVDLPPPAVLLTNQSEAAQFEFPSDTIEFSFDPRAISEENMPVLYASIAHEMAHRYQRFDPAALADNWRVLNYSTNDPALRQRLRDYEARADMVAAQIISPAAVERMLYWYARDQLELKFLSEERQVSPGIASNIYRAMDAEEAAALAARVDDLPDAEWNALWERTLRWSDAQPFDHLHPSILDRLELQTALRKNSRLLTATDVAFDGDANFTSIKGPRLPRSSDALARINREADESLGIRQ